MTHMHTRCLQSHVAARCVEGLTVTYRPVWFMGKHDRDRLPFPHQHSLRVSRPPDGQLLLSDEGTHTCCTTLPALHDVKDNQHTQHTQ